MDKKNTIPARYRKIFAGIAADPAGEWEIELDETGDELSVRAENTAVYIKSLEAETDELRQREDALRSRRRSKENIAERLRKYLIDRMEKAEINKLEMPRAFISVRNNSESVKITDERKFIGWAESADMGYLLRYREPDIIKSAVKECLRNGADIPFAELIRTNTLTIK